MHNLPHTKISETQVKLKESGRKQLIAAKESQERTNKGGI